MPLPCIIIPMYGHSSLLLVGMCEQKVPLNVRIGKAPKKLLKVKRIIAYFDDGKFKHIIALHVIGHWVDFISSSFSDQKTAIKTSTDMLGSDYPTSVHRHWNQDTHLSTDCHFQIKQYSMVYYFTIYFTAVWGIICFINVFLVYLRL